MFQNIESEQLKKMALEDNTVILDVRSGEEWKSGIIEGATCINVMSPTFQGDIQNLDKSKTYLVYCLSGGRSSQACMLMNSAGFDKVFNLSGGISAWDGQVVAYAG